MQRVLLLCFYIIVFNILVSCSRNNPSEPKTDSALDNSTPTPVISFDPRWGQSAICGNNFVTTQDNAILLCGTEQVGSNIMPIIIKMDYQGNVIWKKYLGEHSGTCIIIKTKDENYLVAGYDCITKIDASANVLWNKKGLNLTNDSYRWVSCTEDGGYIIAGITFPVEYENAKSDALLVRIDSQGNLIWKRTFGDIGSDRFNCVKQTPDGGFIAVGATCLPYGSGDSDVYVVKLNSNGDYSGNGWFRTYDNSERNDEAYGVIVDTDNSYIVVGNYGTWVECGGNCGSSDGCIIKIDSDGRKTTERVFDMGSKSETLRSIERTSDGGFIIAGEASMSLTNPILVKTDANVYWEWIRIYPDCTLLQSRYAAELNDGGYFLSAWCWGYYILKTDAVGEEEWIN